MKKMSRGIWAGRLCALLLCAFLLAGALAPFGAQAAKRKKGSAKNSSKGSLNVMLETDVYKQLPSGANVGFTLYKIGSAAPGTAAGWKIDEEFSGYKIIEATTSKELGDAATKLAKDISSKYKVDTVSLKNNAAQFSDLGDGVYLGVLTASPEGLSVTPFIVTIPSRDSKTKELKYAYNVTVKCSYEKPPKTEKTPKPTRKPTTPVTPITPDTPDIPTIDISGTKVWADDGNANQVRPGSISITLLANGSPVSATPSWTKDGDTWTYSFKGLDKEDADGNEIVYTVKEEKVRFYSSSVSGYTITNTLKPENEKTRFSGVKTWDDDDNAEGKRPSRITVRLLQDGVIYRTAVVTEYSGWRYSFEDVPVSDGFLHKYKYDISEDYVPGYFTRKHGMNLTNSRFTVKKNTPDNPTPEKPWDVPDRKTGTPSPGFEEMTDEELEDLFDMFGYGTPLFGILGTGDITPLYPYIFGGVGAIAVIAAVMLGKRRRKCV